MKSKSFIAALAACLLLGLAACEQQGPAERLGENIDDAASDIRDSVEDTCEKVKDDLGADDTDCG